MVGIDDFFEEFIAKHDVLGKKAKDDVMIITSASAGLEDIKQKSSVEAFLDYLVKQHNCLLHGSREYITDNFLKTNSEGKIYATDYGNIAILKAIFSEKKGSRIEYPQFISDERPLEVKIYGIQSDTIREAIRESGIVCVIANRKGFVNEPKGSWQYIKQGEAPFVAMLEVLRGDFTHHVFDVDNNARIPMD
jgi:hypothetical protein